MKILESKEVMTIDEYELYLYVCEPSKIKMKKTYPKLPESEEE